MLLEMLPEKVSLLQVTEIHLSKYMIEALMR